MVPSSADTRLPSFERLRTAILRRGEADCVPLMEFYIHPDIKDRFFEKMRIPVQPELEGWKNVEREIGFWLNAGYDYVPIELSLRHHPEHQRGPATQIARENLFLDYTRRSGSGGWLEKVKGIIADTDDAIHFPWPTAQEVDYSPLERIETLLPADVKVIAQPGRMFQAVWALMGFEQFCISLYTNYALVQRMFEKCCSLQLEVVRRALEYDCVGAVWVGDDLAFSGGLMIERKLFEKLLFPWLSRMGSLCRERNTPFLFHSDGDIREILDDLVEAGVDAVHPIEPKVMDIRETKDALTGRLAVIGNIDIDFPLTRGAPEDVRRHVRQTIASVAPGGGFCIGSANSIPSYIPFENYMALRDESLVSGAYPISGGG